MTEDSSSITTHATQPVGESGIHISLKAEPLFNIGGFNVTNSLLLSLVVLVVLGGAAAYARRKLKLLPGLLQSVFELFIEGALDLMDTVFGERRQSEKYLPLVATIFLFVIFSNWFGLLPGVGSIILHGHETAPLFRAPAADLNFTLALAVITVLAANILGAASIGFFAHASKFFNFKNPIAFFIGLIEMVSEAAKVVSFSFRLFGNIFAGEVLLTIVAFLAPYVVPLPFYFLEVFVGFVQALIFSMLAIVFIAIAVATHEGEHLEAERLEIHPHESRPHVL